MNMVSPPAEGTSLAYSMVPMAGFGENIWSVCQLPPKFFLSVGRLMTASISGKSGIPSTNGCRWISPQRRANASCWAGVMSWSRIAITRLSSRAARISARTSSDTSCDRSTPWTSAPSAPEIFCTVRCRYWVLRGAFMVRASFPSRMMPPKPAGGKSVARSTRSETRLRVRMHVHRRRGDQRSTHPSHLRQTGQ